MFWCSSFPLKTNIMDFDNLVSVPLGVSSFLADTPFLPARNFPFMSILDFIANVSLAGYLVLYSSFFLYSAPSAHTRQIRDGVFLLLSNLLGILRKKLFFYFFSIFYYF